MSATAYSDLKAAWHIDRIKTLRAGTQIVPTQVQIIISDLCNQDCAFCSYRMSNGFSTEQFADENGNRNPKRMIPQKKVIEILNDCRTLGVQAVQFTGGGEPTVHPEHIDIFRHAQAIGMQTGLVTNGTLLRDGWWAVYPKMKWIRVSIDAGNAEEYARVRRVKPSFFKTALTNTSAIADAIQRTGSDCLLGCGYVITPDNWENMAEGVRLIRETGASYVRLSAMFSTDGTKPYEGIFDSIKDCIAYCKALETDTFKVVDLFGNRIDDLVQHSPDYEFCGYQQFNMYIGGNLKVYRCCTTAYTRHGEVGDLTNRSLYEWFYSDEKKFAYNELDARTCNTCQFNGKNRAINYLVGDEPLHVNFV